MKFSKKLLSLLLCAIMVLGSVAVGGEGFSQLFTVKSSALVSLTQSQAVNWARSLSGQRINVDGAWGCQCSDLATAYMNYLWLTVNGDSRSPFGTYPYTTYNANQYDNVFASNPNFTLITRTSSTVPQPGDIFVSENGEYGHIGIVLEPNGSSGATIIHQNKNGNGTDPAEIQYVNWSQHPSYYAEHFLRFNYFTSSPSLSGKPVVTISDGTYCLFSKLGTYVLDVGNGSLDATVYSTANGANIQVFSPLGYTAQRFDIGYNNVIKANYIKNTGSGKYVDSQGDTNGTTNAWQYEGNGSNGQNWLFEDCGDGYYYIRNLWGYYLTVDYDNAYDGQNVGVWYFNGANGQKWKPVKVSGKNKTIVASGDYYIYSAVGDKVLDISNSGTYSSANNTNAQIYSPKQNKCQLFTIDYNDNWKSNNIALKAAGKWVDVEGNECREANCSLYEGNGNACQNWIFEDAGSGYYYIRNMWGYYLSVVSNSNTEGQNVKGLTFSGGTGQKWKLLKTESTKPTGSISSTNNVAPSQTVTLSMSDNAGIAGYYWGTSSSYSSNTYTAVSGTSKSVTKTVSSNGTYYLTVKDTSGNISSTVSKTFYKTTLNANGGSVSPASVITMSGNSFTLPTATRSGYSYKNWNTVSDGSGTSYTGSYKPTGNVTLYAQWTANTYTVTYNANGGTGVPANQTKTYGKTLTLSSTKPTREGYTFLGWAETSTATTAAYQAGGSFTKDANTTLYAVWNKNMATYTVKYDANGGSGAPASQTKIEGTTLALSSTKPTRTGYTFKNWNTKSDGTGTSYSSGATYTANAAVTLYAQWTENHTHNYTKSVTKPTCTQQGYTTYTCSCGETYKSDYVSALGHNYVNGICTGCGDISSEYSLAEAKQIAKSELETARNNAISNEAKGILDFAIITVDSAASIDEVNNIKANAIKAANDADASCFNDNKLNNANINIASEKNFDYRSIVTITATATNVPEGYKLALYVNGSKVAEGDNKSVSYSVGELKSNVNYSVKVLDNNGNVQKDSNGNELSKDSKITVNAGFFKKLVAFFKGLFKALPKVEVKP